MPLLDSGTWQCLEAGWGRQSTEGIHLYVELTVTLSGRPLKRLKPSVCFTAPQSRASITCSATLKSTPCSPAPDHCQTLPIILFVFRACLNIVWPPLTLGIYTLIIHFTPWKSLEARLESSPPPPNPCLVLLHGHETFSTWVIPPWCQRDQLDLIGGGGWVAAG